MWELSIRGVDFYHLINWFFIYSFFGWLWETGFVSLKNGKYVNRGFINGPFCTIYGFGALSVYLILKPVSDSILCLFFGGIVVATVLEYVTAVLMESIFHTSWWDYSDNKFNFQGRICLGASLGWGVFTLLLFKVLHPAVEKLVSLYPVNVGEIAVCVISVGYLVDFAYSAAAAFKLHERIPVIEQAVEQARDELLLKLHEHLKSVSFTKDATLETVKERLGDIEVLKDLEERRAALMTELTAEVERRKKAAAAKLGHNISRFVNSYPNLNRGYKLRKHRKEKDNKKNA
ncbi:MAG: putative ABC transporter permease [Eubacteriales bacterium]|nr:putative ABC transporter permease [Eubacteriales bacterium]